MFTAMFGALLRIFSIVALVFRPQPLCEATLAHHPGHAATHVTRLHRYEHSGLSAMLEAEALWSVDGARTAAEEKGFVQVSRRQHEALQKHHAEERDFMMAQIDSKTRSLRRSSFLRTAKGQKVSYHDAPTSINQPIAERLSSLSSQYVGPIGVGTIVAPEGCAPSKGESLVYLPRASEAATSALQAGSCHVEDQSQVWVVFDTGSTNIWVSSDLCKRGACAKPGRKQYDHKSSSTYNMPEHGLNLDIQFGTGSITGPQGIDDFHIGPFTVFKQTFGMIQTQEGAVFDEVPFEGILGLAFPAMSANGVTPFFDSIVNQGALSNNEFAFYFSKDNPASNAIFWGGVDKNMYTQDLAYYNVTDPYYWSLRLVSFKIGGTEKFGEATPSPNVGSNFLEGGESRQYLKPRAIIDTGTTFFTAEEGLFEDVMQNLPATQCDQMTEQSHPDLTYTLQRASGDLFDFVLQHHQYMVGEGGRCSPAFMKINIPSKHGPAMVLGEVFLRHFFSVFDRQDGKEAHGRIGLAPSAYGEGVERQIKSLTKNQPAFDSARDPKK